MIKFHYMKKSVSGTMQAQVYVSLHTKIWTYMYVGVRTGPHFYRPVPSLCDGVKKKDVSLSAGPKVKNSSDLLVGVSVEDNGEPKREREREK